LEPFIIILQYITIRRDWRRWSMLLTVVIGGGTGYQVRLSAVSAVSLIWLVRERGIVVLCLTCAITINLVLDVDRFTTRQSTQLA
jgi:hypothetical protein